MSGRELFTGMGVTVASLATALERLDALLAVPAANSLVLGLLLVALTWQRRRMDARAGGRNRRGLSPW